MTWILRKIRGAIKRLKTGIQVMLFPGQFCLYPLDIYSNHTLTFSQEGEDAVLLRLLGTKEQGFYVDVGAHHPQRFSNTYNFYLRGWRGINIDAMPGSMQAFQKLRSRDINLEVAISETPRKLTYYIFEEPALNSFDADLVEKHSKLKPYKVIDQKEIETRKLADILDQYLPQGQPIDFLSVDVEGLDYEVLKSNNWQKYRPLYLLVEVLDLPSFEEAMQLPITQFMATQSYHLYCKTMNTLFYRADELKNLPN